MKTRIDILSGFLGAGKTTLILKLLESPPANEKLAICENEYGEVGIDGDALQGRGLEVLEVNAGCVCCTLSINLIAGLKLLIAQHHPDRILLEPTGLANLAEILSILSGDEGLARLAEVGTAAAVLDGSSLLKAYEQYHRYFDAQIASASVLFLNRSESLTEPERAAITERIAAVNPRVQVIAEPFSAAEAWQALDEPATQAGAAWPSLPKSWLASFQQVAVETGWPGSRERLDAFIGSDLAAGLVRAKGFVRDGQGARVRADFAGGQWAFAPAEGDGEDNLQLIGRRLPLNLIRQYFAK